jgi:hypothetical protein
MSDEAERRYQEILKRIAQQKRADKKLASPFSHPLTKLLDELNAHDALMNTVSYDTKRTIGGAKLVHTQAWAGYLLWYPDLGVQGYRWLTLFGVWTQQTLHQSKPHVLVGARRCPYVASVYVAEAYHKLIQQDWRPYHQDDGHPPTSHDTQLLVFEYNPQNRIQLRAEIKNAVEAWMQTI